MTEADRTADPRVIRREEDGYCFVIGGTAVSWSRDWEPNAIKCKRVIEYTLSGGPIPYGEPERCAIEWCRNSAYPGSDLCQFHEVVNPFDEGHP